MTPHSTPIGQSRHPHSPDAVMREARRTLRAAGVTYRTADGYVLYVGKRAYDVIADWLLADQPTVERVEVRYGSWLGEWEMVVQQ